MIRMKICVLTDCCPKPIRKKLRELTGLAYERELSRALNTLGGHFT